jgi:D-serine deaminase-like pyridoxal phosphate-dependent protein
VHVKAQSHAPGACTPSNRTVLIALAQAAGLVGAAAVYYYYAAVKSPRQRQRRLTDIYKVCARGRVSGSWACKRGEHRASSLHP